MNPAVQKREKGLSRVAGKTAIVTGGGSGLGEASSELLAAEGAGIVVTDINAEAAAHTADIIRQRGGRAIALEQDVTDESGWARVVEAALDEFGGLQILVNNAGVSGVGHDLMEERASCVNPPFASPDAP